MAVTEHAALKETARVALGCAVMTVIMLIVCLLVGHGGGPVFLGALIGYAAAVGNFFLMAYTVERLVDKADPNDENAAAGIKARTRMTYNYRLLMIFVVEAVAIGLLKADWITALMPLLFPQIVIRVWQLIKLRKSQTGRDI